MAGILYYNSHLTTICFLYTEKISKAVLPYVFKMAFSASLFSRGWKFTRIIYIICCTVLPVTMHSIHQNWQQAKNWTRPVWKFPTTKNYTFRTWNIFLYFPWSYNRDKQNRQSKGLLYELHHHCHKSPRWTRLAHLKKTKLGMLRWQHTLHQLTSPFVHHKKIKKN